MKNEAQKDPAGALVCFEDIAEREGPLSAANFNPVKAGIQQTKGDVR